MQPGATPDAANPNAMLTPRRAAPKKFTLERIVDHRARRKVHIIGTHEPQQLAEAIQTARAMAQKKALESP